MTKALVILILALLPQRSVGSDYLRFEENGKIGLRDEQGHVVLAAAFDALGWSDGSFSLVGQITGYRQKGQWGLLNLKKEFITHADFQELSYGGGDRVIARRAINSFLTRYGCLNLRGEVVIPFVYDEITVFETRCIVMNKNGIRYEYGLVDLENRPILPTRYERITPLGSLRYAVGDFSGKTAICDESGKWITDFVIDSISRFQSDLAIVYEGWRAGVIHRNGEIKTKPEFREIRFAESGLQGRKVNEWKLLDIHQKVLQRTEADELVSLSEGRIRITLKGKSGLVDDSFQELWPLTYDFIGPFNQGKAIIQKDGKYGLYREDQSAILTNAFDSIVVTGHLVKALSREQGKPAWRLYDTVGVEKTTKSYDWIGETAGNTIPVAKNGYFGALDPVGKERIACVYDSITGCSGEYCAVKFRGQYGIITRDDQWIVFPGANPVRMAMADRYLERSGQLLMLKDMKGTLLYFTNHPMIPYPEYLEETLPDGTMKEINYQGLIVKRLSPEVVRSSGAPPTESEGLTVILRDGKYGFVDDQGRLRIANRYEAAQNFQWGLAPVKLLGRWGLINTSDEIVVQPAFDSIEGMWDGLIHVSRNGKHGLINRNGKIVLAIRYDNLHRLDGGHYILQQDGLLGLVDGSGHLLIEARFESIAPAGAHHVIVGQAGRFGLLTLDGLSVFPMTYDQLIYLPDENAFFARQRFDWQTLDIK